MNSNNKNYEEAFKKMFALVVVLTAVVLTWHRLFFGIDFTDEAFYIALAYRFALGDIPLRDEQNLAQFAALLFTPLIRIFLRMQGNTDGIVLFVRHLHLVFTILVGFSVFISLRPLLRWPIALLIAGICIVFVPFNIHGLSYNTMGCGLFTIGCFLSLFNQSQSRRLISRWPYFISGCAHCLAILVYPTLLIPVIVFFVLIGTDRRLRQVEKLSYIVGGGIMTLFPLALIFRAGMEALPSLLEYVTSAGAQGGGWEKVINIGVDFGKHAPNIWILFLGVVLLVFWHLRKPRWFRFILPFLPLLFIAYIPYKFRTASLYFIITVALLGPFIYPFVVKQKSADTVFNFVWLPSFVGGLVTAWSSSNGAVNAGIGMFPAALASIIFMVMALESMPCEVKGGRVIQTTMVTMLPFFILLSLLVCELRGIYGENASYIKTLTNEVAHGPYSGIKTTKEKAKFLARFAENLKSVSYPNDTLLIFYDFPAGYLISNLHPLTNSVWLSALGDWALPNRAPSIKYYERKKAKPTLVVIMKNEYFPDDALTDMVKKSDYYKVFDNDQYSIFRLLKFKNVLIPT